MAAYYNEHDPPTAAWLRELIREGLIADGDVDERSIVEVTADDVRGFVQCHWFAGIGGWSYALRLAGWPDARKVWTGSCPCQPFSSAGKGDGEADPRDLWPAWFRLLRECRPDVVFGEQVEAAARGGWFDRLSADLEKEDYAVGACVLGAHSVGAFHIRQRLWFVADSAQQRQHGSADSQSGGRPTTAGMHRLGPLADTDRNGARELARELRGDEAQRAERAAHGDHGALADGADVRLADDASEGRERPGRASEPYGWPAAEPGRLRDAGELGHTNQSRSQGRIVGGDRPGELPAWSAGVAGSVGESDSERETATGGLPGGPSTERPRSPWAEADWIACRDGKSRPVEPGTFPLAHGVPARVGRLRGYGNAIVPQVAAAFIEAYCAAREARVRP